MRPLAGAAKEPWLKANALLAVSVHNSLYQSENPFVELKEL